MFVEKLSLFGFKSFNDKVAINFGAGITGVIGPNGCGKSNIVDALRWVLGEQSTRQLRGSKMEDVIFNGARSEKPMSLAQVELTVNNDRGVLPVEYTTVKIGRRLYRSGVSEYTINGNVVRLKDIRELFFDTGMGSHAYSVIERQMVDNILSDTTGHRRFLFEEAAGIMKYKSRKKDALTKLEATDRDLLRVNDIITEVERQVSSLRRQVGKARRYRELMEEARGLDLGLSQRKRAAWLGRILDLDTSFRETDRAATEADAEVATIEARLQELHLAALEEERRLRDARELLAQTDDELGRAQSRSMVLRERQEATRQRIAEAGEHAVRLADRLERNEEQQTEGAARLARLEEEEVRERSGLEERERDLRSAEERVRNVREQTAQAQQLTLGFREDAVRAESAVGATGNRLEDIDRRVAQLDERLEALHLEEREHAAALEVSNDNVRASRQRVEDLIAERERLVAARRELETRADALRVETARNREAEAAARSRLETLEDLRARYEGFAPGVRALMLDEPRPDGVLGTLSDLVQVPADWVRALEPALSTAWQFVVTADTATAVSLVRRLDAEGLGFAHLIALDRIAPVAPRSGGPLWASEAVETGHRDLVRHLIGDLALTETLDDALELVRSGAAPRAATREGQYVDAAVIAGGEGGPVGAELLEREEGLARCRAEIDRLIADQSALTGRETALRDERDDLDRRLAETVESLTGAQEAQKSLEKEQAQLALQVRHTANALSEVEENRGRLGMERSRLLEERTLLERTLAESREKSTQAEREHRDAAGVLTAAEAEREAALARVHELRVAWARLEGELRDARSGLDHMRRERDDLLAERERTLRDESDAVTRSGEIDTELRDVAVLIQELHGTRAERLESVSERERERADAAAREQQDSDLAREARRRASTAREAAHHAELELTRLRTDLGHLEERLRAEYETTPEELDRLAVDALPGNAEDLLLEIRERIRRLGPVNALAVEEYEEKRERFEFMSTQRDDLLRAKHSLLKTIDEINGKASGMFLETFAKVQENFQKTFQVLFQGGECSLTLTGDDPLEADIDVVARPRGKRPQSIAMLSSGERALTAIALLFAIYLVKPSPFCILDEVDAPLDDANIDRFVAMIREFSKRTQFIMITHNKKTMEAADCLYGVTMQRPGVSSVVSVRLDGAAERTWAGASVLVEDAETGGNGNGTSRGDEDPLAAESSIAQ